MKILKKSFSYGLTSSANFNSVRIDRSIEVEFSEDDFLKEQEHYQAICDELKESVHKELEYQLVERATIERERQELNKKDAAIPVTKVVSNKNIYN